MKWPWKKEDWSDYTVNLSIGTVRFRKIKNGMLNKILNKSTVLGGVINNGIFISLFEQELCELSKKQIDNLTLKDGSKLREAVRNILVEHNILQVEQPKTNDANIFSNKDVEWFDRQKSRVGDFVGSRS